MPSRNRWTGILAAGVGLLGACGRGPHDVLIRRGLAHGGSGGDPVTANIAIAYDRISFTGNARTRGVTAHESLDATGLIVAPGVTGLHALSQRRQEWANGALPD